MANIKFFRALSNYWDDKTPQEGYIWFNASNNTIQIYKNGEWEIYTGKVNDVVYNDNGTLVITKHDGTEISVPLGDVQNISDLSTRLSNLETNVGDIYKEFTTTEGKDGRVVTLEKTVGQYNATVGTHSAAIATIIGKLAGIDSTVVAHVTAEFENHKTERETIDKGFESSISTLQDEIVTLVGGKDEEGNFVDANKSVRTIAAEEVAKIVDDNDESDLDTLKEIAAWIKNHPEDAGEMNEAIQTNTANIAKNAEDIAEINTTIEQNELTVAAALADLDTRVTNLDAKEVVTSVAGENYIVATPNTGGVTVKADIGIFDEESAKEGLALVGDVKTYVDNT